MNTPSPPREPTMEEILASIRRIIAEEGQGAPATPVPAPATGEAAASLARETGGAAKIFPLGPVAAKSSPKEDILELTDLIEDERPAGEAAVPPPAAVGDPLPLPVPDLPAPELPVSNFSLSELSMRKPSAPEPSAPEPFTPAPAMASSPPAPPPAPAPAPAPATAPAPSLGQQMVLAGPAAEVESPLLTLMAEQVVHSSMREVAEAIRSEKPAPAAPTSTPLEGLVLEALRPALKSWIDQNLPDMVERLMKDELRRLARRIEDE